MIASEHYDGLVLDSMHELRYFNQRLKNLSEQASKIVKTGDFGHESPLALNAHNADHLRTIIEGVLDLSQLFTTRLDFIDVELNPDNVEHLDVCEVNLFGKFDKARRMLNALAREKRVKVCINGDSEVRRSFDAYTIIDILPYLILDNAVKYSPEQMEVDVDFIYYDNITEVTISSYGPTVPQTELKTLVKKHYRGESAMKLDNCVGRGLGLYFVDYICELHDIELTLNSQPESIQFEGIPHSQFEVTLKVPWNT
ncbi:sensor histidine kinase [Vibrio sp. FF112]|uniref:sensor histidine kinase n=1 Tax=unclassified Vibrio TaxID=2614977 RepID=UPI00352CD47F